MDKQETLTITPTLDTSAYADGDIMGQPTEVGGAFSSEGTGIISTVHVTDKDDQKAAFDILLFSSEPSNISSSDNAALEIPDADLEKLIAQIEIYAGDYKTIGSSNAQAAQTKETAVGVQAGSASVWAVLVARGAPTYTVADALVIGLHVLQNY